MKKSMSTQNKLQNNSVSPLQLLDDGQKKEKLNVLDQTQKVKKVVKEYTTSMTLKKSSVSKKILKNQKKESVMQESVPTINEKIYKDKSNCLKKSIQIQELSKISEVDSIGKDQDYLPFWNQFTQEMSQKLWLPTKIDCVVSDMNLWNSSLRNLMSTSWFSVEVQTHKTPLKNFLMTSWQSLQSSLQKTMACEQQIIEEKEKQKNTMKQYKKLQKQIIYKKNLLSKTNDELYKMVLKELVLYHKRKLKIKNKNLKKEKLGNEYIDPDDKLTSGKTKKIRIYPTKEQKETLNKWFGISRWIYNKCIDVVKTKKCKANQTDLRKHLINNENYKNENTWCLDYHYDLKDEAMRTFLHNIKTNEEKGKPYTLSYKSKKNKDSISVLGKHWNKNNWFQSIFNSDRMKSSEPLPKKLLYTSRLLKTVTNKYFISIPEPLDNTYIKGKEREYNEKRFIFIDPGVKNFITGYDPSGKIITWGKRDIGRIARLLHYSKKLQSKIDKCKDNRKKRRMKKANLKINEKIFNLVEEMHKKLTLWLVKSYDYIYIPRLNFHNFKNLNKTSKKKLASLRHCSFLKRLQEKTREYSRTKIFEVSEVYTSKTCTCCGAIDNDLGNKDIYECKLCNRIIERDITGARNIMLRYLTRIYKGYFDKERALPDCGALLPQPGDLVINN